MNADGRAQVLVSASLTLPGWGQRADRFASVFRLSLLLLIVEGFVRELAGGDTDEMPWQALVVALGLAFVVGGVGWLVCRAIEGGRPYLAPFAAAVGMVAAAWLISTAF